MAEDPDRTEKSSGKNPDPAALGIALSGQTLDPRAAEYLREQTELARLQKENLREQNAFELSHLRWRRFNDQMKGALQIIVVLLGAVVLVAIATAMWNASEAEGLVVEAFAVPPSYAQAGIGGDVVADDLTNKISAVRDVASNSISVAKSVRKESGEDIKVEIPETGVSLAQAWRYLRAWLGHERRVTGNLRDEGDGQIALTVAMEGAEAFTTHGARGDLDKLEQQAAEKLFAALERSNYANYLENMGRLQEGLAAIERATSLASTPRERARAISLWSLLTLADLGDTDLAISRARISIAIDPRTLAPHRNLVRIYTLLGHEEDALKEARLFRGFRREDQPLAQQGRFDLLIASGTAEIDDLTGDFAQGYARASDALDWNLSALSRAQYAARLHDVTTSRALLDQVLASGPGYEPGNFSDPGISRYYADAAMDDWRASVADLRSEEAQLRAGKTWGSAYVALRIRTTLQPLIAVALAHALDFKGAQAEIADTPFDCVPCVTARGEIEMLEKNQPGAAKYFALADRLAPSIPYAYAKWGEMLLRRGDFDGAIRKFEEAHRKGPHFADPLEMWGEALMQKNRSDLALAKFDEANRYAPRWGRLHLKWGEALVYAGRGTDAVAQYRSASMLDLSTAEKAELARDVRH